MIYVGQVIKDIGLEEIFLVCHINHQKKEAAVADLPKAEKNANISKPRILSFNEITALLKKKHVESEQYKYPAEMSYSDTELVRQGRENWLKKRDDKYQLIGSLTTEHFILQYLYGDGLADEIEALIPNNLNEFPDTAWKTTGAYYNTINRYIVFGCNINALLPCKLKNSGSNYFLPEKPGPDNVKRGRGGADNSKSRSKSMGVTLLHKNNLKATVAFMKAKENQKWFPKFVYKKAIELYQKFFESTLIEHDIGDTVSKTYIPFDEEECLSEEQLRSHLKSILDKEAYLKIRYGQIAFDKDFEANQGSAHDGVIGSTYRYETDATVLDLYVRYPFDTTGQLSMGRPILYIVVDVSSTFITGFYLGFDGPNWTGASQALVNACSCKVEFAARYGVQLNEDDWPAHHIPVQVTVDNGTEHPDKIIESVLRAELGIRGYNFTAVYRGDAKGTVESQFDCLNNQVIHFTAGAIPEAPQRGEQHPSNQAFWDYDTLVAMLIREIIYHNQSADRLKKFNINAVRKGIDITPKAIFLNSLKDEMNGGRDARKLDPGQIRWAFLPEETASVRGDGIHFDGLVYYSDYAKKAKWFTKAKLHGAFHIPVKRTKDWSSHIWHKTPDGEYIRFDLINVNDESPFVATHWEPVQHLLEQFKDKRHKNKINAKKLRLFKEGLQAQLIAYNQEKVDISPDNVRISMQPGVKDRQSTYKALQHLIQAIDLHETLIDESNQFKVSANETGLDDLDTELNL
jgi:putative transposase